MVLVQIPSSAAANSYSQIKYWFYVFFVGWDVFEAIFMYFFFVETKGLTLEELDDIFEAKDPRKASVQAKKLQKVVVQQAREDKLGEFV